MDQNHPKSILLDFFLMNPHKSQLFFVFLLEVATIKTQAENLVDIDTVLGPMLAKMDNTGQAWDLVIVGPNQWISYTY